MKVLCVIPARFNSTRLYGKPLRKIGVKTMIELVYEQAKKCRLFDEIVVAADSTQVMDEVNRIGGAAIFTDPDIKTGSDRVYEAAKAYAEADIVVNLQCDEPFIEPNMLEDLVLSLKNNYQASMSTLACELEKDDITNPSKVKVAVSKANYALFFTRCAIPYKQNENFDLSFAPIYRHQGIYAFRRDFLGVYCSLEQTQLEMCEMLEQMRAIENGYKIAVCLSKSTFEINTIEDLQYANEIYQKLKIHE